MTCFHGRTAHLFHKPSAVCVRQCIFIKVRLGKHGGNTHNRERNIPWNIFHCAPGYGPQFDLFEQLGPGGVARFAHVHILRCKSFRLHFKIILRNKKIKRITVCLGLMKRFLDLRGLTFTNMTTHFPRTLLTGTLL